MATMIIVEDDALERRALKTCIAWELIGIEIIGEASNGLQGLNLAIELNPDIILTDVSMPVMNAIDMAKKVRNIFPDIKIIFLSSYDEFEYARQGIDLNIFAYFTKPVNESELLKKVKKASDEIEEKKLEKSLYSKIKNNYQFNMKLLQQMQMSRILMGIKVKEEELALINLGWIFKEKGYLGEIICMFEVNETGDIDRNLERIDEICKKYYKKIISLCIHKGVLVIIFWMEKKIDAGKEQLLKDDILIFMKNQGYKVFRVDGKLDESGTISIERLHNEIWENMQYTGENKEQVEKKKGKIQIVNEVEKIIQDQYSSAITIESIAKLMHFTPNYIGTVFKNVKGCSINRYLMQLRLEKAKELLKEHTLSVTEIASQCGYENITYFHLNFKKETGFTPKEYRKQYKEQ